VTIFNPTSEPLELQLFVGYHIEDAFYNQLDSQDFKDKMLRQMAIFMKGVSLESVDKIYYMFDTF